LNQIFFGLKESLCVYFEEATQLELFGNKKPLQAMTNWSIKQFLRKKRAKFLSIIAWYV